MRDDEFAKNDRDGDEAHERSPHEFRGFDIDPRVTGVTVKMKRIHAEDQSPEREGKITRRAMGFRFHFFLTQRLQFMPRENRNALRGLVVLVFSPAICINDRLTNLQSAHYY